MLLDVEVVHIHLLKGSAGEDSRTVGCPHYVDDDHTEIKAHNLCGIGRVPDTDSPVSRGRNEGGWVIVVPADLVDCE